MNVTLYKYENKQIIVDKTNYLLSPLVITGEVPNTVQDMETPVLYLKFTSEPDYNYAYIQEYHRYYYVTSKVWLSGNVWSFSFAVDELYTYRALVKSLSGKIAYSMSGSMYKFDPRLNYNVPPKRRVISYTARGGNTPNADEPVYGGTPMYMIRTFSAYTSALDTTGTYQSTIKAFYLTPHAFTSFISNWYDMLRDPNNESLAVAIGSSIIDVTRVYYIGDVSSFSSDRKQYITFSAPAVRTVNSGLPYQMSTVISGTFPSLDVNAVYDTVTTVGFTSGCTYDFSFLTTYYWHTNAKYTLFLPFIGTVSLDLKALGLSGLLNPVINVNVRHDPWENAYIVSFHTPNASGNAQYFAVHRIICPVTTSLPFPVDTSFENEEKVGIQKLLSVIGNGVSLIGATSVNPVAAASFGSFAANSYGSILEIEQLHHNAAMSVQFKGQIGGSPDYRSGAGYDICLEMIYTEPSDNFLTFWADHGYPDGATRSLNAMTGFVQMQDFEMIYESNATVGEMQRLEQQLYKGVIL